ncbi:hypothetical protein IT570_08955 [Candidatus Sumerlaeota bacterium]|nr:hypothetical protein [Candidatus Sumerlaeota bacterium]
MRPRVVAIAVILACGAVAQFATARPEYYDNFAARYPTTSLLNNYGCNICHKDRELYDCRNPYGADVSLNGGGTNAGLEATESLDSDGDGVSNIDEIDADTAPGRPDAAYIVNRLLGLMPAANGDADVNCGVCEQGCAAELYVVDCADVVDALRVPDFYHPPDRGFASIRDQIQPMEGGRP